MLNFIQEPVFKPQITKKPHIDFGISAQAPKQFHLLNTMVSRHSYVNPFVKIDQDTLKKLRSIKNQSNFKDNQKNDSWTARPNINNHSNINTQDGYLTGRVKHQPLPSGLSHSMNLNESYLQLSNKQKQFHKKKGECTQFIQNHIFNIDLIGPMIGKQRSSVRYSRTKQLHLQSKQKNLSILIQKYQHNTPRRSVSPLLQKNKIHLQRLQFNQQINRQYNIKNKSKQRTKQFQLPKINKQYLQNSVHELKSNYKKYKNQSMSKSLLMNSVSMFKDNKKSILNKNVKSIHNQIR